MPEEQPIDRAWRETINLLEVPNSPGLFVLGSFARRVTVYSQQVRALNLVDALAGLGYLSRGTRVAVVGAGFAGMTASAALVKLGVEVLLFEKEGISMYLQKSAKTRYLHPHIYDWPMRDLSEKEAKLPILGWMAGDAHLVRAKVWKAWSAICDPQNRFEEKLGDGSHPVARFGQEIELIEPSQQAWQLKQAGAPEETFDLIILAAGFGEEKNISDHSLSYWADIAMKERKTQNKRWLISGSGDGALTDAMNLCILYDDHGEALERVVKLLKGSKSDALKKLRAKIAEKKESDPDLFSDFNHRLILKLRLRKEPIYLNASEDSISGSRARKPTASVLNRLVAWMLIKNGKIILLEGKIPEGEEGVTQTNGKYKVHLEGGPVPEIEFEKVLKRHGPVPIVPDAGWLPPWQRKQMKRLRRRWLKLYEQGKKDPTLGEEWPEGTFEPSRLLPNAEDLPALLLYSKSALAGAHQIEKLEQAFQSLLKLNDVIEPLEEATGLEFKAGSKGLSLEVSDAVKDARSFGRAVQALCRAPLVIANGTEATPALALLLGIRAAVRRGVTIVFRTGPMNMEAWKALPFNLREIRIVEVDESLDGERFSNPLRRAIKEGLLRYSVRPLQYGDLPGFDALRNLGGDEGDYAPRPGESEVLVLCPFDEFETLWRHMRDTIHHHYFPGKNGEDPARRVIDMASPEMLTRRLFEGLRRNEECVVDLSGARANVLFELGIRLAVHPRGAHVIRCPKLKSKSKSPKAYQAEAHAIHQLFCVKPYAPNGDDLAKALRFGPKDGPDKWPTEWPDGKVSERFVFSVAERCIAVKQEAGGHPILTLLWQAVSNVGGSNRQKQATPPVMYAGNSAVRNNARRFVFDGLRAYLLLASQMLREPENDPNFRAALMELPNTMREIDVPEDETKKLTEWLDSLRKPDSTSPLPGELTALINSAQGIKGSVKSMRKEWEKISAEQMTDAMVRDREEAFKKAVAELTDLTGALTRMVSLSKVELIARKEKSFREEKVQAELTDCHGVKGGVYRDWGKYGEAAASYATGRACEKEVELFGGTSGSYCLVQELVNRVLLAPEELQPNAPLRQKLEEAREEVRRQLKRDRRSDPWAWADLAIVTQLTEPKEALDEWEAFEDLTPPKSAYDATKQVIALLFTKLEPALSEKDRALWKEALEVLSY